MEIKIEVPDYIVSHMADPLEAGNPIPEEITRESLTAGMIAYFCTCQKKQEPHEVYERWLTESKARARLTSVMFQIIRHFTAGSDVTIDAIESFVKQELGVDDEMQDPEDR